MESQEPIINENAQVSAPAPVKKTRAKAAASSKPVTRSKDAKKKATAKKTGKKNAPVKKTRASLKSKASKKTASSRSKAEAKGKSKRAALVEKKRKVVTIGKKPKKVPLTPEERKAKKEEAAKNLSPMAALDAKTGPTAFKLWLENRQSSVTFPTLRSYINTLQASLADAETAKRQKSKMSAILRILNAQVESGETVKRRVPGTGVKKTVTLTYLDTPANQRKGCVGKTYEKVVYEGGEFVNVQRKRIKSSRLLTPEEKKIRAEKRAGRELGTWMKAAQMARDEFPDAKGKCVLFIKTLGENPTEKEIFANKVYLRAKEIHATLKAESAAAAPVATETAAV